MVVGEPFVAAPVLREGHVREVDDVDVEVHEESIAASFDEGLALDARRASGSAATSSTGITEMSRRSIAARSKGVACSLPQANRMT